MSKKSIQSIPIFLAFLVMGFGDVSGPLTSQLQTDFELSNFLAGLVTFMGFIMFGLISIPLGLYQDRKGKKHVLTMGLFFALLGLVIPIISNYSSFILILLSLLLLGAGAATLQVSGNPIMRDVSPEGKYSRNLSFGQFIKGIGSFAGAIIPMVAAKYWGLDWKILFPIYSIFVAATILFVLLTNIEEKKDESSDTPASLKSCLSLLKNNYILLMVLGIFLYVGAEVSMSAKLPNYLEHKFNFDIKELGLMGTLFFFLTLLTGRFLGGVILNWVKPAIFLIITAILSILGFGALYIASGQIMGFVAISIIGFGFANIFPLVFSITVDHMPERGNEISGLMITAIIGGAILPIIFGVVADAFGLMAGFIVPFLSVLYIFIIAIKNK